MNVAKSNLDFDMKKLAHLFECGRTQISTKQASESFSSWKKCRPCESFEINQVLHKWYPVACSKNMYPVGPQLCEKAKDLAERFGVANFQCIKWVVRSMEETFQHQACQDLL